jgi:chromosome segregation ATPase
VSRLQIEKKEAESAGKSFYEQFKDLQKSSKANESALLVEVEQDLSIARSECKRSEEEAEALRARVEQLESDLRTQTGAASESSAGTLASLATTQAELASSEKEARELRARLEEREGALRGAREVAEALQQDMQRGQSEAAEVRSLRSGFDWIRSHNC